MYCPRRILLTYWHIILIYINYCIDYGLITKTISTVHDLYFLTRLHSIFTITYVPSKQDILQIRKKMFEHGIHDIECKLETDHRLDQTSTKRLEKNKTTGTILRIIDVDYLRRHARSLYRRFSYFWWGDSTHFYRWPLFLRSGNPKKWCYSQNLSFFLKLFD